MAPHKTVLIFFICLLINLTSCERLKIAPLNPVTPTPTQITPSPKPPTPTPTPTPIVIQGTLDIWHSWSEAELPILVQIIADFNLKYPDVLFSVLYVPEEDLQARFETEVREGGGPTLLLGPAEWGPALYDAGVIADLSGKIEDSVLRTLNQPALGAARFRGALIGLPYSMEGVVLYRNKDILTITADTFEEFVSIAQTATQGKDVGAMLERSFLYSGAHLDGIGGQLMDENGYPTFTNEQGVAWLELLRRFEQAGPTDYASNQDLEYFKAGKVGWVIDGTWNMRDLAEALGPEKLAIDPWPAYDSGHLSGYVFAENLYLSSRAQGDTLNAALKFTEFFLSHEAQTQITEIGRIPATSGVTPVNQRYGLLIAQAMTALAGGTTYPVQPAMNRYLIFMDIALQSYFNEGVPADDALKAAYEALLVELAGAPENPTPSP